MVDLGLEAPSTKDFLTTPKNRRVPYNQQGLGCRDLGFRVCIPCSYGPFSLSLSEYLAFAMYALRVYLDSLHPDPRQRADITYLEGHGDLVKKVESSNNGKENGNYYNELVSRLILWITRDIRGLQGVSTYLLSPPDPPSTPTLSSFSFMRTLNPSPS